MKKSRFTEKQTVFALKQVIPDYAWIKFEVESGAGQIYSRDVGGIE